MVHEFWMGGEERGTVCLAGPRGDVTRMTLRPGAELVWTFEASSHFDAMTKYFEHRGWAAYTTTDAAHDKRTYADRGWE